MSAALAPIRSEQTVSPPDRLPEGYPEHQALMAYGDLRQIYGPVSARRIMQAIMDAEDKHHG